LARQSRQRLRCPSWRCSATGRWAAGGCGTGRGTSP